MTSKPAPSPAHLATSALHTHPSLVNDESSLLAASLPLPPNAVVLYVVLRPNAPEALEAARRILVALRAGTSYLGILESVVFNAVVDGSSERLHVFAIDSAGGQGRARKQLAELKMDNMVAVESGSFTPGEIFPCSRACAAQRTPCSACMSTSSGTTPTASCSTTLPASAALLPRQHLRLPYAHLLRSLVNAITEELCSSSTPNQRICRMRDGVVLFPPLAPAGWGIGWEHHNITRALVSCKFDIALSPERITFTPLLHTTTHRAYQTDAPPNPGAPITLLPLGTPAYFLSEYAGSRSALTAHFRTALAGRGCGPWDCSVVSSASSASSSGSESGKDAGSSNPHYVVVWIAVQNAQGEDKGLAVVWPSTLTLTYVPSSVTSPSSPFAPLAYTPTLPPEMQPAPPAPVAPHISSLTSASTATPPPPFPPPDARHVRPVMTSGARTVRTLALAFQTPEQADVGRVAGNVSNFVDEAVRHREVERQNMLNKNRDAHAGTPASVNSEGATNVLAAPPIAANMPASPPPPLPSQSQLYYPSPNTSSAPTDPPIPPPEPIPAPVIPMPQAQMAAGTFDAFGGFDTFADWGGTDYLGSSMGDMNTGVAMDMNMSLGAQDLNMNIDMNDGVDISAQGAWGVGSTDDIFTDADFDFWGASAPVPKPAPRPTLSLSTNTGTGLTPGAGPAPLGGMFNGVSAPGPSPPSAQTSLVSTWLPPPPPANFVLPTSAPLVFDLIPPCAILAVSPSPSLEPEPKIEPTVFHPPPATSGFGPIAFPSTLAARDGKYGEGKFAFAHISGLPSPPEEDMLYTSPPNTSGAPTSRRAFTSRPHSSVLTRLKTAMPRTSVSTRASLILAPTPKSAAFPTSLSLPITPPISAPMPVPWHARYTAATDPRPGIVRALKRKATSQGARDLPRNGSAWHDAWEEDIDGEEEEEIPASSEEESSFDEDSDDKEDDPEGSHNRARTPLPPYLLLGPSLLSTEFAHAHLLPHTTPLRPRSATPFASSASTPPATGAMSVPTPVSPATLLGAASEKAKSLEAAAQLLAREIVESTVWADAWEAGILGESLSLGEDRVDSGCSWWKREAQYEAWATDMTRMLVALQNLRGMCAPLSLATALGDDRGIRRDEDMLISDNIRVPSHDLGSFEVVQQPPPLLAVSKGPALVTVLPSALSFWQKLGLGPRSGPKDVVVFVFFEDAPDGRIDVVSEWLERLGTVYESCNFGKHTPGRAPGCTRDGLVPVRFDAFRKSLATFVQGLTSTTANYVFYLAAPAAITSLASPVLRQVFSAVKRAQKTYSEAQILFQFLPVHLFFTPSPASLCYFAFSVYDRVARPADRAVSHRFSERGPRIRMLVREPAFALAPPRDIKVNLVREHPLRALDVVERHSFLHIAYGVTGHWLLAAAIDERGTAHELGVWVLQDVSPALFIAQTVWAFTLEFASRASVEWRVFILRTDVMGPAELDAWAEIIDITLLTKEVPMHVSLSMFETERTPAFLAVAAPLPPSDIAQGKQVLTEGGMRIHSLPQVARRPVTVRHDASVEAFVPDPAVLSMPATPAASHSASSTSPAHVLASSIPTPDFAYLRPLRSAALVLSLLHRAPILARIHLCHEASSSHSTLGSPKLDLTLQEALKSLHDLAILAQAKRIRAEGLPWHLAAVRLMEDALGAVSVGE